MSRTPEQIAKELADTLNRATYPSTNTGLFAIILAAIRESNAPLQAENARLRAEILTLANGDTPHKDATSNTLIVHETMIRLRRERDGLHELHNKNSAYAMELLDTCDQLRAALAVAREALDGLIYLSNNSRGIAGWHLNGDVLPWEQVEQIQQATEALARIESLTKGTP